MESFRDGFSFRHFLTRYARDNPPYQLEGFKMAERDRMSNKRLVLAMGLAIVVGSLASFWALVSEFYRVGGEGGPAVGHIGQFNWLTIVRIRFWVHWSLVRRNPYHSPSQSLK